MTFSFQANQYRYASRRTLVYGKKGMVCTSQPLAAQVGLDILKRGGNAVDAAVASAAALTVLEPTSNGIGGDAFALIWVNGSLHGLNGSGFAPGLLDAATIRGKGFSTMPTRGWEAVNVPGIPSAWAEMTKRFGKLPLIDLLEPAASYAEEGYPVSPTIAKLWQKSYEEFSQKLNKPIYENWFKLFAPKGRSPQSGEIWRSTELATTLRKLGKSNCESFYRGDLAKVIVDFAKESGGYLRLSDLAKYRAAWVEPVGISYKDYEVWEIPPNGQGIIVLMALNLLKKWNYSIDEPESLHRQIEALKLAFADGKKYIADPQHMLISVDKLLSELYAAKRRRQIVDWAIDPKAGNPFSGGTVYLCTADGDGNMVSFIQSNYMGFGSGVVVPNTGIALNNRAANFSLDVDSENYLKPYKKPYHTIIPGFLTKGGYPVGPFGVMGAFMQPQGQLQVLLNLLEYKMNPQEALDAPRWQWVGGRNIEVEATFMKEMVEALATRGHNVRIAEDSLDFGRGQIIWRDNNGVLVGATEPRSDGCVAAW